MPAFLAGLSSEFNNTVRDTAGPFGTLLPGDQVNVTGLTTSATNTSSEYAMNTMLIP